MDLSSMPTDISLQTMSNRNRKRGSIMKDFPFKDDPNTAAFTCRHVLEEKQPILYVSHDPDGYWQFLCGRTHQESDARIVSLESVLKTDSSLKAIATLDYHQTAERESENDEWEVN